MKRASSLCYAAATVTILLAVVFALAFSGGNATAFADETLGISIYGSFETETTRQMLNNINDLRQNDAWYWNESDTEKIYVNNLQPLVYDYTLERVAMQRAAELAITYAHTRPNGTSCFSAYPSSLFYGGGVGENIAYGYQSPDAVFTAWAEADEPYAGQGHRRNMLSRNFKAVGVGCFWCNGTLFWAQAFSGTVTNSGENIPDWYPLPTAEFINGGFTGEWEYYTTDADARRVLICRDSYASAMHAILGSYFSYMDLCHFTTFRQELIDEKQPDVFVKEITERYQEQLLSFCLQEEPKS